LLAGLALVLTPQTSGAADSERVKFESFYGVEIHGTFYASSKGTKAPCALLLHAIGGDTQQEGWAELASKLQDKGFTVLMFDFRGHGDSKSVDPENFYRKDPNNRTLRSYNRRNREQISYKDFTSAIHFLSLVNDIAAAKRYLDKRNDANDCNSSNIVVIGAESGAALGALWIRTEWAKMKPAAPFTPVTQVQFEGQDIACLVSLSLTPEVGLGKIKTKIGMESLLTSPIRDPIRRINLPYAMKDKVPMYFMYGEQDTKAAKYAQHLVDQTLHANDKDPKLRYTGPKPIRGTKLSGIDLIKPSLDTANLIETYASTVVNKQGANPWSKRDVDRTIAVRVPVEQFWLR
jgi:alpha-beta hydrolase superfamily lysophospholipase